MEDINGRSSEFATLHCGIGSGGPCNETTGSAAASAPAPAARPASTRTRWSTTAASRRSRSAGTSTARTTSPSTPTEVDATTWNNATHHGFFVIFNVAMGGGFPAAFGGGPTASTQSGVPMLVDYCRGLTSGGGATTPPRPRPAGTNHAADPPTTASPSGSATQYLLNGGRLGAAERAATNTVDLGRWREPRRHADQPADVHGVRSEPDLRRRQHGVRRLRGLRAPRSATACRPGSPTTSPATALGPGRDVRLLRHRSGDRGRALHAGPRPAVGDRHAWAIWSTAR